MKNFFISYTSADRAWAEWIAWQLKTAGLSYELQAWHCRDGPPVIEQINQALVNAHTTIAVLSPAYFNSAWCKVEWQTALNLEITNTGHRLLPVQIESGDLPPVIHSKARVTLLNLNQGAARERLLQSVQGPAGPPATVPKSPLDRHQAGRDAALSRRASRRLEHPA